MSTKKEKHLSSSKQVYTQPRYVYLDKYERTVKRIDTDLKEMYDTYYFKCAKLDKLVKNLGIALLITVFGNIIFLTLFLLAQLELV